MQVKSNQVYFIATFKMRKRKQRKTIQSHDQNEISRIEIMLNYSILLSNSII